MGDSRSRLEAALRGLYELDEEIGVGGMAHVYLARDVRHDRNVALKVLDPEVAAAVGPERFLREIRAAANLQHPHILPLFDSGDAEGLLFYVMPFVQGPTLRERLDREGPLPVADAVRIAAEVGDALDHAHRHGVIHRDIKPANILLQEGHALVADFGIAHHLDPDLGERLTETGRTIGTPRYMSPEQASGDRVVDARTDIYSLGCVLYEMLTGRPPFEGRTTVAILSRALTEDPPPVTRDRPAAAGLEPVIARALQRIPADRFETAGDMVRTLESAAVAGPGPRAAVNGVTGPPADAGAGRTVPASAPGRRLPWIAVAALLLLALGVVLVRNTGGGGDSATVAVLPFRPLGEGAAELAPGISVTTRDRLAVIDGIDVIGGVTSSTERFRDLSAPEIAAEVGADYILRASVAREPGAGAVEVRPELYGANGTKIGFWDEEPLVVRAADLSALETRIAEDVASALDLTIGAASRANLTQPRSKPAAYEAYLRGLQLSGPAAEARMQEAVALDSTFALVHAWLAGVARSRFQTSRSEADSAAFHDHAAAAIRHGPRFAGGYIEMGLFHRTLTLDADSALYYLDRARELAPGDAVVTHFRASVLWLQGRLDSALVEAQRGAALDRLSASAVSRVSRILLWLGELEESWDRHLEARPTALDRSVDFALADGALILAAKGQPDSARALTSRIADPRVRTDAAWFLANGYMQGWLVEDSLLARVCAERPDQRTEEPPRMRQLVCGVAAASGVDTPVPASVLLDSARVDFTARVDQRPGDGPLRMRLAYVLFFLGDRDAALAQADTSIGLAGTYWDYYPGATNALAYARLAAMAGDAGRAVPQLELMLTGYSPITPEWLRVDPAFEPIRSDPRFRALLD